MFFIFFAQGLIDQEIKEFLFYFEGITQMGILHDRVKVDNEDTRASGISPTLERVENRG